MTSRAQKFWSGIAGAVIVGVILWAFTTAASGGVVTGTRFKTDSVRRDKNEARRDSITERTSRRVDLLVCRDLKGAEREACLK